MMVVPQLVSNITNAVSVLPDRLQDLVKKITELARNNDKAKEIITELYNNSISFLLNG